MPTAYVLNAFSLIVVSTHNFWEDVALMPIILGIANKIFNPDIILVVAWQPQYFEAGAIFRQDYVSLFTAGAAFREKNNV